MTTDCDGQELIPVSFRKFTCFKMHKGGKQGIKIAVHYGYLEEMKKRWPLNFAEEK